MGGAVAAIPAAQPRGIAKVSAAAAPSPIEGEGMKPEVQTKITNPVGAEYVSARKVGFVFVLS